MSMVGSAAVGAEMKWLLEFLEKPEIASLPPDQQLERLKSKIQGLIKSAEGGWL